MALKNSVTVATTDPIGNAPMEESINRVKILRFKSWAPQSAYYFSNNLRKYLKANSDKFDIVHAHSYHAFPALFAAQFKKKQNLVFTPHYNGSGHTFLRHLLHYFYRQYGSRIFDVANRVIVVSSFEKNLIEKDFKKKINRFVLIPNGLNLHDFRINTSSINCSDSTIKNILYVGRLEKYKGVEYILKVLPLLDKNFRLTIVGEGPYKKKLVKIAKKLGIENRTAFLSNIDNFALIHLYSKANVFVSLSKFECYGITVAEALASGTPCVLAKSSALIEWIDNKSCFGIDYPINIKDLANTIKSVNGKIVPPKNLFDWADITSKLSKVYEDIFSYNNFNSV